MFMTQRMHVSILMMQTHLRHENNNLDRLCCASQFQDALRLSLNGTFKRCRRISWLNTAIPASFCCASRFQDAQTSQSERGFMHCHISVMVTIAYKYNQLCCSFSILDSVAVNPWVTVRCYFSAA